MEIKKSGFVLPLPYAYRRTRLRGATGHKPLKASIIAPYLIVFAQDGTVKGHARYESFLILSLALHISDLRVEGAFTSELAR